MAFTPYAFTDAQLVDIRRFCGYPALGDGNVVFPFPWIMKQYLALEYRLQHVSASEGAIVVTYLGTLNTLETAIPAAGNNLDTDVAAVWTHNKNEVHDRDALFANWRRKLCAFLGIPVGPNFDGPSCNMQMVV
jgi:hypothetical protein